MSKNKGAFRGGGLGTDPAGAGGARGCQGGRIIRPNAQQGLGSEGNAAPLHPRIQEGED